MYGMCIYIFHQVWQMRVNIISHYRSLPPLKVLYFGRWWGGPSDPIARVFLETFLGLAKLLLKFQGSGFQGEQ